MLDCGDGGDQWHKLRILVWPFELEPFRRSDTKALVSHRECLITVIKVLDGEIVTSGFRILNNNNFKQISFWELLNILLHKNSLSVDKLLGGADSSSYVTVDDIEWVIGKDYLKTLDYMISLRRMYEEPNSSVTSSAVAATSVKVCNNYKEFAKFMNENLGYGHYCDVVGRSDDGISKFLERLVKDAQLMVELIDSNVNTLLLAKSNSAEYLLSIQFLSACSFILCLLPSSDARFKRIMNRLAFLHVHIREKKSLQYLSM